MATYYAVTDCHGPISRRLVASGDGEAMDLLRRGDHQAWLDEPATDIEDVLGDPGAPGTCPRAFADRLRRAGLTWVGEHDGWDLWRAPANRKILTGADLREADLAGADLAGADLRNACLRGADLNCADLRGADLAGADLSGATLCRADLRNACLRDADLSGATLHWADLSGADLSGTDLSGARLDEALLEGARLAWKSHDLLAELLRREAGGDVEKRKVAGLILVSRDWCWQDFLDLQDPLAGWALSVLREYVVPGDDAPEVLRGSLV